MRTIIPFIPLNQQRIVACLLACIAFLHTHVVTAQQEATQEATQGMAQETRLSNTPYQLNVGVRFLEDPRFTDLFVNRVQQEIKTYLTQAFQPLINTSLFSNEHPVFETLNSLTLQEAHLNSVWVSQQKNLGKLVLVDVQYQSGRYEIISIAVDQLTQQVGPLEKSSHANRKFLSKAIVLQISKCFSPLATAAPLSAKEAKLLFQGEHWKPQLKQWLPANTFLKPYWAIQQSSGVVHYRAIPHTYLQLKSSTDFSKAAVISNLSNPWRKTSRIVGVIAVKQPTLSGKLRLKIIDPDTGNPVHCSVAANDRGFQQIDAKDYLGTPDPDGILEPEKTFQGMAYLQITQGGTSVTQLPIPITSAITTQVCKISVDTEASKKRNFFRELRYVMQEVQDMNRLLESGITKVNQHNAAKQYPKALTEAKQTLTQLQAYSQSSNEALQELSADARKLQLEKDTLYTWATNEMQSILSQQNNLQQLTVKLDNLLTKKNAQERANVLIELGKQAEQSGEFEEAMTRYELALFEQPDQPDLKQKILNLKEALKVKSPEHEQTRNWIRDHWAKSAVSELSDALPKAMAAFETLKKYKDQIVIVGLVRMNGKHLTELSGVIELLVERNSPEDIAEQELYVKLTMRLADFQQQLSDYLKSSPK